MSKLINKSLVILAALSVGILSDVAIAMDDYIVCGYVEDAIDCTDSALRRVRLYKADDPSTFYYSSVNPVTSAYCGFIDDIDIGDIVIVELLDSEDGYTAESVSVTVTGEEPLMAPTTILTTEDVRPHPHYPECPDRDNDYINDVSDNCPFTYDPWLEDLDGDGIGNACDKCDGPCPCSAVNIDGVDPIDLVDLSIVAANWAQEGASLPGDVDGSEKVDFLDLVILIAYWLDDCSL